MGGKDRRCSFDGLAKALPHARLATGAFGSQRLTQVQTQPDQRRSRQLPLYRW
jgi:hypothetical protein